MIARVAVIDIGSNSIKLLVGERGLGGGVRAVATLGLDARISAGISREHARLGADGMSRGLEAIRSLLLAAEQTRPDRTVLVATSAVRDAQNGQEFAALIQTATGHKVRILSGEEEAKLIGRGLVTDPGLRHLENFCVFDLGGGSLECLAFRARQIECAVSFPLGCVRMTERFINDVRAPVAPATLAAIAAHVRATVAAGFVTALPAGATAVATGGTIATLQRVFSRLDETTSESSSQTVEVRRARTLLHELAALPLSKRREFPGLPAARADVFPAALATLLAIADHGSFATFHQSMHTLRHGLADALLAGETS